MVSKGERKQCLIDPPLHAGRRAGIELVNAEWNASVR
jgi:hypothetical protein